VLAKSGKAVEVAGDVDVLLLDKTGTITYGDRQATAFHALAGHGPAQLREAALLASLADPTPEGKSIVKLAREQGAKLVDEPERRISCRSPRRPACRAWICRPAPGDAAHHPQGRRRCHRAACANRWAAACRRTEARASSRSPASGATPLVVAMAGTCSAWSNCPTSSSTASRNASRACARWASRR
jgi:high-affinity K+ transport system ATPase subunit B